MKWTARMIALLFLLLANVSVSAGDTSHTGTQQPLTKFNQRYALWFVFESTCSSCLGFAPTVYNFTKKHNIQVRAISKDNKPIRTWKGHWSRDENAVVYRLGVEDSPTPVLLLMDSVTKQNLGVGIGIMTEEELENRLYELTNIHLGRSLNETVN